MCHLYNKVNSYLSPHDKRYQKLKQDHLQSHEDDFLMDMDYENDDDEERNIILNQ